MKATGGRKGAGEGGTDTHVTTIHVTLFCNLCTEIVLQLSPNIFSPLQNLTLDQIPSHFSPFNSLTPCANKLIPNSLRYFCQVSAGFSPVAVFCDTFLTCLFLYFILPCGLPSIVDGFMKCKSNIMRWIQHYFNLKFQHSGSL